MSYCIDHPQQKISAICVSSHKCQRKLCDQCMSNHLMTQQKPLPINIFLDKLQEKVNQYKLKENQQKQQFRVAFKCVLDSTEQMIIKLYKQLDESIEKIFSKMEEQDQSYINLLDNNSNPTDSSINDLEQLVQILEGNTLEDWNNQKNYYMLQLETSKNWLEQEMKNFSKNFNFEMSEILSNFKYIEKSFLWNYSKERFINTEYQKIFTKQKEIQYIREGSILRSDIIIDSSQKPQMFSNLEQIQYLNWIGAYGKYNQKVGKWLATWKGEPINKVGGQYSDYGRKLGKWKELINNYWSKAQAYEIGEYENGQRRGAWKCIYGDKEIGQGDYNSQGRKEGKWIELTDGFWDQSQAIFQGEYRDGKKVGQWDIKLRSEGQEEFELIGGGSYNESGDEVKIGKWIELPDGFNNEQEVTLIGEYEKGNKFGRWDILYKGDQIGGGSYDEGGQGIKIGEWIELNDGYDNWKQISYSGQYKNGKKVGRWDTYWNWDGENKQIGGGLYDEERVGIKIGRWVELSQGFRNNSQVTYNGEYKNGNKIGRWDIMWKQEDENEFKLIGGGLYDEVEDGTKIGNWTELSEGFWAESQVAYVGEYKKGIKIGRWDILYHGKQIGGGLFDEEGNGLKIGKWVDISEGYQYASNIIYIGEYKNGKKVGRWDVFDEDEQIGGGSYDEKGEGMKFGKWIEPWEKFDWYNSIVYNGEYLNGKKVGLWVQQGKSNGEEIYKEIRYDN
ncbi:unnamed protein product [Paramecium primaurelia]|uniref:MORN repeat protein n=1 Tax=Paramecium primaurelia TaxID=5886 RepID=A0A8S1Q4U7_PARPR|nr:unnamed protein product [Paramecium primaurelia]